MSGFEQTYDGIEREIDAGGGIGNQRRARIDRDPPALNVDPDFAIREYHAAWSSTTESLATQTRDAPLKVSPGSSISKFLPRLPTGYPTPRLLSLMDRLSTIISCVSPSAVSKETMASLGCWPSPIVWTFSRIP